MIDIWGTLVCFTYVDYVVAHDEVLHKPVTLGKVHCRYSEREDTLLSFRDLMVISNATKSWGVGRCASRFIRATNLGGFGPHFFCPRCPLSLLGWRRGRRYASSPVRATG